MTTSVTKTITKENVHIEYNVTSKNIKNINMRVDKDGRVTVSKPHRVTNAQLEDFMRERFDWVINAQQRMSLKASSRIEPITDNTVMIFDSSYSLIYKLGKQNIYHDHKYVVITGPNRQTSEKILESYLKELLFNYCESQRREYDGIMDNHGVKRPIIKIYKMKKRWGSCLVNKNIIHLSHLLIHCSKAEIDYVMLHEYMHFIEPNHSADFYKLVEIYMPEYRELIKRLKNR